MPNTLGSTISKLKSLPLKYKLVVGVVFLSLTLILLNSLTKSPVPPTTPISPTPSSVTPTTDRFSVAYTGPALTVPSTLPTYSLTPTPFTKFAQAFAQALKLNPHPNVSNLWITPDKQGGLAADSTSKIISYNPSIPKVSPPPGITPAFAVSTTKNFLNSLGLTDTTILESQISYSAGDSELQTTTSPQATYAQVPFTYAINSYPLIVTPKTHTPHEVVIRSDGQILKLNFSPPPLSTTPLQSVSLISFAQAITALKNRQGTIVSLQLPAPSIDSPPLTALNLTESHLEYRPQNNQVVPFYSFTGTASTKGLKNLPITIILPATKP